MPSADETSLFTEQTLLPSFVAVFTVAREEKADSLPDAFIITDSFTVLFVDESEAAFSAAPEYSPYASELSLEQAVNDIAAAKASNKHISFFILRHFLSAINCLFSRRSFSKSRHLPLRKHKVVVNAAFIPHKLVMAPDLSHFAVVKHNDFSSVSQC